MQLLACSAPTGALVAAPMTALQPAGIEGEWQGFWGEDDGYYVRRLRPEGGVAEWYRLAELASELGAGNGSSSSSAHEAETDSAVEAHGARPARMRAQLVLGGRASRQSRALIVRRRRSR
jgi:hypothetical protein